MTITVKKKISRIFKGIRRHFLNMLLIVAILATIMILAVVSARAVIATERPGMDNYSQWEQEMQSLIADPGWCAEQEKLHKKHGKNHVIIYEPDKEPYYVDKKGKKHCFN